VKETSETVENRQEPAVEEEKVKEEKVQEEQSETTQSTTIREPEDEDSTIVKKETVSRLALLDRLFRFLKSENKPLNPVLAGYFTKLVTLLINRKSKQLMPYVFAPESTIIDRLVEHVY
jgi:serine/threonine-protein phosphatase 6 regulatory subunit 1